MFFFPLLFSPSRQHNNKNWLIASSTTLPILLLLITLLPKGLTGLDRGPGDCQANEVFLECGSCEGSCKQPIIGNCRKECKPPRCECQAKAGFVRAHDGACIRVSECATYQGAYFGTSGQMVSSTGTKNAPKTVLNNFRQAGGGFSTGKGAQGQHGPDEFLFPPAPTAAPSQRIPSPPSIAPPSAFHSPPVMAKHRDLGGGGGGPQLSQMNLFADTSNSQLTAERNSALANGGNDQNSSPIPSRPSTSSLHHSVPHPPSPPRPSHFGQSQDAVSQVSPLDTLMLPVLGDEEAGQDPKAASCGNRNKCKDIGLATGAIQMPEVHRRMRTKSQPYLYAYINPPIPVNEMFGSAGGGESQLSEGPPALQQQLLSRDEPIPPLPANLRIFRQRRL